MQSQISKWGHSLAIRIPKAFAQQVQLEEGQAVDISIAGGQLIVTPQAPAMTLEALLADVTPENLHTEVDMGGPVGRESW